MNSGPEIERRIARWLSLIGFIMLAVSVATSGPLIGFGASPVAFPVFVFGAIIFLAGILTLIYYRYANKL